jgi:hypothetical protein
VLRPLGKSQKSHFVLGSVGVVSSNQGFGVLRFQTEGINVATRCTVGLRMRLLKERSDNKALPGPFNHRACRGSRSLKAGCFLD